LLKSSCNKLVILYSQGDREQELGLPFSPLCDRKNTLVAESQIGKKMADKNILVQSFSISPPPLFNALRVDVLNVSK